MEILKNKKPDIRYLYEMKEVLYDKNWAKNASPRTELYYMYRGIKKKDGLRYDITVIPARMLGKEFVKTKGHEHTKNFGEIYIVLKGNAIFLIQKRNRKNIEEVFAIRAKKGDVAIIPAGYGHFTINPSPKKTLVLANWVSEKCKSNYLQIEKMKGACYYYTKDGWIKNENYKKIPPLKFKKPRKSLPKNLKTFLE